MLTYDHTFLLSMIYDMTLVFHAVVRGNVWQPLLCMQLSLWPHVLILFTGNKRIWGFDLKTPVYVFQYGQIRSLLAFPTSVRLTPLVTPFTLFSVHWIWASLYLSNRGHHTTPGKAGLPDYFSSSSTATVQQQQFVQFLILCLHPEDFQCKVPSQKAGNQCEACAIKCI